MLKWIIKDICFFWLSYQTNHSQSPVWFHDTTMNSPALGASCPISLIQCNQKLPRLFLLPIWTRKCFLSLNAPLFGVSTVYLILLRGQYEWMAAQHVGTGYSKRFNRCFGGIQFLFFPLPMCCGNWLTQRVKLFLTISVILGFTASLC